MEGNIRYDEREYLQKKLKKIKKKLKKICICFFFVFSLPLSFVSSLKFEVLKFNYSINQLIDLMYSCYHISSQNSSPGQKGKNRCAMTAKWVTPAMTFIGLRTIGKPNHLAYNYLYVSPNK